MWWVWTTGSPGPGGRLPSRTGGPGTGPGGSGAWRYRARVADPTRPETWMIGLVTAARVARLATHEPDGRIHLVPCCYAVGGAPDRIVVYSAVDAKPKRSPALRRLLTY